MTAVTVFVCLCLIALTEVASWTVDLDEVRQFLDNEKAQEDYQQLHYHNYYDESEEYEGFGEVRQGHRGHNYAHQYGYEGYMEKKVHGYIYKGAQYLDGLRLALENYKQLMENCSVYNFTEFNNLNASLLPDVRWNETADVWNWAQGETKVQWPQMLNIIQNTTQSATVGPTPSTPLGGPVDATQGTPPGAPVGATPGAPTGAPLGGPSDSVLGAAPGALLGGSPGAPPGAPLGAPPGAPLGRSPGAPPSSTVGAPPGSPQGGSPGEQPGIPLGSTLGTPLGSPPGDTLDVAPNDPLGVPSDAMLNLRQVAMQRSSQFLPESFLREQTQRAKCEKATREREHVRRLADLALFTARQLQNLANQEMQYDESSMHAKEERELIMRLAYFLDKLAEVTGYTPDIKVFNKPDITTTTTANPMPAMSEQLRQLLLSCMRRKTASPEASAPSERCPAPLLLPPLFMRIFNITEDNITTVATTTATPPLRSSAITTTPSPIHIDPELRQVRLLDNYFLSNLWAQQPTRTKKKRSINEPLMKMIEYYTKHKAWTGANEFEISNEELNVQNQLMKTKSMEDRSDYFKRKLNLSFLNPYKNRGFRRAKNPIIKYGDKLNIYLGRLRKSDASSSNVIRKFNILPRKFSSKQKRSIIIQEPEDPMKDISYYVKNKPGTNVRPSVVDAVRVRASLERIFNTGNIEVVRRYGANYNPLIPSPFYFGIIKTISDI